MLCLSLQFFIVINVYTSWAVPSSGYQVNHRDWIWQVETELTKIETCYQCSSPVILIVFILPMSQLAARPSSSPHLVQVVHGSKSCGASCFQTDAGLTCAQLYCPAFLSVTEHFLWRILNNYNELEWINCQSLNIPNMNKCAGFLSFIISS